MKAGRSITGVLLGVALLLASVLLIWASDRITLQGERTLFAVSCEQGQWEGERCTGRLVPGDRYAFRTSKSRREVLHWIRGSQAPSGKYTDCNIKDRDNWSCDIRRTQGSGMTRAMTNGVLTDICPESTGRFHWVSKWKWWALRIGIASFDSSAGSGPDCAPG